MQTQHTRRGLARILIASPLLLARLVASSAESVTSVDQVRIPLEGAPTVGAADARITMVEFADYQCPLCSRHFNLTLGELFDEYVKTGKMKYVVRDFPLNSIHPLAAKAAEAAHCAGEQGKYWEMHDRFLRNQLSLGPDILPLHATMLGVDMAVFQGCLSSGKYEGRVRESVEQGKQAGVKGTPWIFLGHTENGLTTFRPSLQIEGAQPVQVFREAIDRLLNEPAERRSR